MREDSAHAPARHRHIALLLLLPLLTTISSCRTHQYVDLGLPSGTLWATCNVGATSPGQFGDFFSWGETKTKKAYVPDNYRFWTVRDTLRLRNDAAHRHWRGAWRMPTVEEWGELMTACTWRWSYMQEQDSETKGYFVIGPNGNQLFLPAAGDIDGNTHYGINTYGDYWSSTSYDPRFNQAQGIIFYSDGGIKIYSWGGASGHTIRPVKKRSKAF